MTRQNQGRALTLNCFSPPVMIATFTTEITLAAYTSWRYRLNNLARLSIVLFVSLATFQLAEYFVCTGYGLHAEAWSRLGFVAISALPPLGLHIMHELAEKPNRKLVNGSYATMAGFMAFFLMYNSAFIGHQCTGNYVIFQIGDKAAGLYGAYYYGFLLVAIVLGMRWANEFMNKGREYVAKLQSVRGLVVGYFVFLIPVAIANTIKPQTRNGIPSIMCGFAVIMAFIVAFYILPRMGEAKQASNHIARHS